MRGLGLAFVAVVISTMPAEAAWQYYACPSDNFASQFPDPPRMTPTTYSMPRHKAALSARNFEVTVDNIIFRMLVADYSDRVADGASIFEEAIFQHTEADDHGLQHGTIISSTTSRIEPVVRGAVYGRSITMDLPMNGGRTQTNFYFYDGKLYQQSVTITPANGDYGSSAGSRFVESLIFNLSRVVEDTGGTPPNITGCGPTVKPFTYK